MRLTITWKLFNKYSGMMRSSECRKAIPFAMSNAKRTACGVSTITPFSPCSKSCKDPLGIY